MRVELDHSSCQGMGICEGIDPERFQVQMGGTVKILTADVAEDELEVVQEAVDMCPTESLKIRG